MIEPKHDYFELARSWADERDNANARSRRVAWTIAIVAVSVAMLEAVALALAMPLKTVMPIGVLVDRTTGHVERIDLDQMQTLTANEALQQSLLAQYVVARESYDPIGIGNAYRKVVLWSGRNARASYIADMRGNGIASRLSPGGRSIGLDASISSISMLESDTALVRFSVAQIGLDGRRSNGRPYVATIRFGFRGEPMAIEDRLANPLGFEVLSYRVSGETSPQPDSLEDKSFAPAVVPADPSAAIQAEVARQTP